MDTGILISIIIPAFNSENYLDRAVQSVLCQMDGSIELILVNDGSTDGTGVLFQSYEQTHKNVQAVHKLNGGLSSARNAGIAAARGEYLIFLDSDDYLSSETCREIRKIIDSHHPDCIDFGWRYISNGINMPPRFHKIPKNTLLDETVLKELILPPLLNLRKDDDHFIFDFSCTKVFRKKIILENNISFDENRRIWEDRPFVIHYLKHCRNFYSLDCCLYNYVDVPNSLSRKYSMDFFRIIIENYQMYRTWFEDQYDFDTKYVNGYWSRTIDNMIFRSLEQSKQREKIRENILKTLQNPQVIHWYKHRTPTDNFELQTGELILSGQYEKAIASFEKNMKKKQRQVIYNAWINSTKRCVQRLLGRR